MPIEIDIDKFLELRDRYPAFDVRTPDEFEKGHIKGVHNLPLFTNEERAEVGTIYKQVGKQEAIYRGLELVGSKMTKYIDQVKEITDSDTLLFHCWRGGMRSNSMAWLFEKYGKTSYILSGGYKSYRRSVNNSFEKKWKIIILGGLTGSGKTEILIQLVKQGEKIINLEKLANHKGSSFGSIGENAQPSTEHFNNLIFEELNNINDQETIWIEDESHMVGTCYIPDPFWNQMRAVPVIKLEVPKKERIERLIKLYTISDKSNLIEATKRIQKRLGAQHVKAAVEAIEKNNLNVATDIILTYYDKAYKHGISRRQAASIYPFVTEFLSASEISDKLIAMKNKILT